MALAPGAAGQQSIAKHAAVQSKEEGAGGGREARKRGAGALYRNGSNKSIVV